FNRGNSSVNIYDLKHEKGPGSYNQPLNNTTTVVYDLPFGKGKRFGSSSGPVLRTLLGGWRTTLINSMASGLPINITWATTSQYTVSVWPSYRPNALGDPLAPAELRTSSNYFNKANLLVPIDPKTSSNTNPFGNLGRNPVR